MVPPPKLGMKEKVMHEQMKLHKDDRLDRHTIVHIDTL